jgi:hypothetical protein
MKTSKLDYLLAKKLDKDFERIDRVLSIVYSIALILLVVIGNVIFWSFVKMVAENV